MITPRSHLIIPIALLLIVALHAFGMAAMVTVPFGNRDLSFFEVLNHVTTLNTDLLAEDRWTQHHMAFLVAAGSLGAAYLLPRIQWVKVAWIVISLLLPLGLLAGGFKGGAQWILAVPVAPLLTVGMLVGSLDGETYAEGFICFAAMGWWMWLWGYVLWTTLRSRTTAREIASHRLP
jgi:hypothetical protein